MAFTFRMARRDKSAIMIGIGGPSKSGKTYSALRLATGLAQGGPIFMIDTESGRGLVYADKFKYMYGGLDAPFTSERYTEIIEAAVKEKAAVIIIDSMSHEHEGPGGMLDRHETELTRMAGEDYAKRERMKFAAWIKPKQAHNRFVNTILQINIHMIFCFRAKDKLVLQKNKDGKIEPVKVGWTPICSDRFEYETAFMLMLPEGARGVPDLDSKSSGMRDPFDTMIPEGKPIDEALGKKLAEWAAGGEKSMAALKTVSDTAKKMGDSVPIADASQPQHLIEGTILDWCAAMDAASTLAELEKHFAGAIEACAKVKDKAAQSRFVAAKDKRKSELKKD